MNLSFIVIAYNEEKNIERTLSAIAKQDGLSDYEIVVVNDGSKDGTLRIVQGFAKEHLAVRIVDLQPNRGRGGARAAGIEAAKGAFYVFVDADIVLPEDWLVRCMPYMKEYDACGGVAVPDGDVSFVHRVCKLQPKAAPHTTTVTGSNGLFKSSVFSKISFDPNKRNGEDVDLGFQIKQHGIRTITVPGLFVDHLETKTYAESVAWLFESGIGASRQLYEHPKLRMPDLAFFGLLGLVALGSAAALLGLLPTWVAGVAVLGFISASSLMHLNGKFWLMRNPVQSLCALVVNDTLLLSYYLGRFVGLLTEWRKRKLS